MLIVNDILRCPVFKFDKLSDNLCAENMHLPYRVVGIDIPFLLQYFNECDVSFKVSTKDANEQHSCQKLAIFTVLT